MFLAHYSPLPTLKTDTTSSPEESIANYRSYVFIQEDLICSSKFLYTLYLCQWRLALQTQYWKIRHVRFNIFVCGHQPLHPPYHHCVNNSLNQKYTHSSRYFNEHNTWGNLLNFVSLFIRTGF